MVIMRIHRIRFGIQPSEVDNMNSVELDRKGVKYADYLFYGMISGVHAVTMGYESNHIIQSLKKEC